MARQWRLRHKLFLGLFLLIVSVILTMAGSIFGLTSYAETMELTNRKLEEMQLVTILRDRIQNIATTSYSPSEDIHRTRIGAEKEQLFEAIAKARKDLDYYRDRVNEQPMEDRRKGLDLLARVSEGLQRLEVAINDATAPGVESGEQAGKPIIDRPGVRQAHAAVMQDTMALFQAIIDDVGTSFRASRANHRRSLFIAGSATAVAVVLVLTLLHYFRTWIFTPISQIQEGVQRVRDGEFERPIILDSKDELAELASEFNSMTTRLHDVYADLARQVNERTRQLVRSERMVSVGFMAAGVAHEINNPLASIAFCAEALERRLQNKLGQIPEDAEVVMKYLGMMQEEAQRCKQITQKLLDFSRSGGRSESANLIQLIQDVIEVARCLPTARSKVIVFEPTGSLMVPMRVPEIKGVVLNILVNGLESMDDHSALSITVQTRNDYAEVCFQDSGCGMNAETLNNIFEPFFTRSRTGQGTGLGLATSHLIIDQHGGTIIADSAGLGEGSTFTIKLPMRETTVHAGHTNHRRIASASTDGHDANVPFLRSVMASS